MKELDKSKRLWWERLNDTKTSYGGQIYRSAEI